MATTQKGIYYPNDYTKVADVPADMKALAKSVDTVIDDINNDINLANRNLANVIQLAMTNQKNIDTEHETNTQQDKDIANLKTENEELKAENERLNQDLNALPSNTAEGEYITLTDSADSRFNMFKIKGNSIQNGEPTPSNQIKIQNVEGNINITVTNENIVLNGYSTPKTDKVFWGGTSSNFTPLKEGWGRFVLNNQGSSNAYVNAYISIKKFKNIIKPNASYQLLVEFRNVNISSSANANYFCICSNYTNEIFNANIIYNKNNLDNKLKFSEKITTKSNIEDYTYLFRSFLSVSPGSSISLEVRISLLPEKSSQTEIIIDNQEFVFPLSEGQVLRERDYLADDGIHHKRNTVSFNGTENWKYDSTYNRWHIAALVLYNSVVGAGKAELQCNYFKYSNSTQDLNKISDASSSDWYFYIEDKYLNGKTFPEWLQEKNSEGKPLTVEYNIVENKLNEYVEAYTDEQKQVYDELVKTAKSYKTVTNIFSTNEVSPKFEVEYRQDIKSLINNVSQAVLNNA